MSNNSNSVSMIGVREFRENLNEYADLVDMGKSFIVMRHAKPLFEINPLRHKEVVIDFTEIDPDGVPADEVLAAFKKMGVGDGR